MDQRTFMKWCCFAVELSCFYGINTVVELDLRIAGLCVLLSLASYVYGKLD